MEDNTKVQLKINAINQLRLLRMSTFKDKLCFLDEDIQNAQRAKAKEFKVSISTLDKTVTLENNGEILTDPQCLFSIAESGWSDEIKETENPFGTGFFSNISVSDYLEIFSGNKHIIFDVGNMINTQNTDIFIEEVEEEYLGFKLILHNFNFNEIKSWDIEERVKMLGQYVHEVDVYYRDKLIEKKDLTQGNDNPFQIQIDEDNCKGWLSVCGYFSDKINIFYKGRLVTKLDYFYYLTGDIHISDKILTLTSPDRKDIIRDSKFDEFKILIRMYAEDMCNKALLSGDDEELEKYSDGVSHYVDKGKVKNLVKFATFMSDNKEHIEYLKGVSSAKLQNPSINNMKEYCLYLEKNNVDKNDISSEIEIENKPKEAKGIIHTEGHWSGGSSGNYTEASTTKPEIDEKNLVEEKGDKLVISNEITFWMTFDDIIKYETKFNIAKHYKLRIIVARNKVEKELLTAMKNTDNVLHISELKEDVIIKAILSNTELSIEEQRADMIFNMISTQILNQKENLFAIGDLMVTKTINVESISVETEIVESDVTVIADKDEQKVYIDRTIIDKNYLSNHLNEELELNDYKFILNNLINICKEIGLCITGLGEKKSMESILEALGRAI